MTTTTTDAGVSFALLTLGELFLATNECLQAFGPLADALEEKGFDPDAVVPQLLRIRDGAEGWLPLGSISSGTLRPEDTVPAFLDALETVDAENANRLWDELSVIDFENPDHMEACDFLDDELFGRLNDHCPPFCYFGSHPGDGADFGVWTTEEIWRNPDYLDELTIVAFGTDWTALDVPTPYVFVQGERGGGTLYRVLARPQGGYWSYTVWSV